MKFKYLVVCSISLFTILLSTMVSGQTVTRIKGVVYADYYYNMDHHDATKKDQNAFGFRRIYFTFENNLYKDIKMRFRLESAHPNFGNDGPINPFIKHAYLEWANLFPNHKLYMGIAETNAFKNAETYWGYRSIEKTIMDLNKISSSADMGIALKGDLSNGLHHWLTLYNGEGYKNPDKDKYKKLGYALWLTPVKGLMMEGYADYEKQDTDNSRATGYFGGSAYYTLKGFLGYIAPKFTLGAEWFQQTFKEAGSTNAAGMEKTDLKRRGMSFFGSLITPIKNVKLFARYDMYDPNTGDDVWSSDSKNGLDDDYTLIIAGLDFIPKGNIHFMPNIMIKKYALEGKDNDVTARLTLYYKYDSSKITI